jgi:hypothetical protein
VAVGQRVLMALTLAVVGIFWSGGGSGPVSADGVPLRQVDWPAVLANDPAVTIDPDAFRPPGETGPFVRVMTSRSQTGFVEGYASTNDVLYADLDGDGADEAVIPIYSGGTAGTVGFLVYREGSPAPKLTIVQDGYKLGFEIDRNRLVISEANYVGFEANCCPSSITRTVNALEDDHLVTLATEIVPNDVQEPTVWSFYQALSEQRYDDAYAFFSPAQKASNPFDRWKAGYATTQSIQVETSPGETPNEVTIALTAVDTRPGGGTVTRRFRGAWTLIWSGEQKRWLLDKARIEPA